MVLLLALDMGGAARDLARMAAAAVEHDPVTLTVKNISSLGPAEAAEIRRVFETELRVSGQPSAAVEVTISENLTAFVLAAEVRRGGDRRVLLESWPRVAAKPAAQVTLTRSLLWEEDRPILDAARSGDTTLVLDAAGVSIERNAARQSVPIAAAHPWPRDLRGRLSLSLPAFTAWLPGVICRGEIEPQLSIECHDSQDPWLLGPGVLADFTPARNYFTGNIFASPGGSHQLPPFFTAAQWGDAWLLAGVDGRARIYTSAWEETSSIADWNGDVAAITTPCGARLLGAGAESIQPLIIENRAAVPAGPAIEFSGPVTALWPAGTSATVVTHHPQTGHYEAYSLAPACGS